MGSLFKVFIGYKKEGIFEKKIISNTRDYTEKKITVAHLRPPKFFSRRLRMNSTAMVCLHDGQSTDRSVECDSFFEPLARSRSCSSSIEF